VTRPRKLLLGLFIVLLLAPLALLLRPRNPEPVYNGRKLHVWNHNLTAQRFLIWYLDDVWAAERTVEN
jgi:hypothetical protein